VFGEGIRDGSLLAKVLGRVYWFLLRRSEGSENFLVLFLTSFDRIGWLHVLF